MQKIKFTILGASGFIGSELKHYLYNKYAKKINQNLVEIYTPTRQEIQELLFTNNNNNKQNLGIVFYCIGMTADYIKFPFDTINAHVVLLSNLLQKYDFQHLFYCSSMRLYDSLNSLNNLNNNENTIFHENSKFIFDTQNSRHLYDLSKALGENLCLTIFPQKTTIIRLACVYSEKTNSPGFLSELLTEINKKNNINNINNNINLNSSPNFGRNYIHLNDVIFGLVFLAENIQKYNQNIQIFNFATEKNTYNFEIANALKEFNININFALSNPANFLPLCSINNYKNIIPKIPTDTITFLKNYLTEIIKK